MGKNNKTEWPEEGEGYLEISDKGFGFLNGSPVMCHLRILDYKIR